MVCWQRELVTLPGKQNKNITRLMRRSALRYAFGHPWQLGLSFIGIMLGVMMLVAVDLANNSARRAFSLSVESVTGTITHQIVGGSKGVPDEVYTQLRTELGIRTSAPNLSGQVRIEGQSFTLLGLDAISEASLQRRRPGMDVQGNALGGDFFSAFSRNNGVLISQGTADNLKISSGDAVSLNVGGEITNAYITAIFQSSNAVASEGLIFADIAVAQNLLKHFGFIDSIDLILSSAEITQVNDWLPAGLTLIDAKTRNDSLQQMSEAFHVNLMAMSMLSLLVAGLLIYNTVTLSVIQRQQTLGIFRSLGVSRQQIFHLILGEAALLGLVASLLGLVLGFLLGQALVTLVSRTINDLYFTLNVTSFLLEPLSLLKGFVLGLAITLLSAALPAWHATHSPPVTLRQRAVQDKQWLGRLPALSVAGVGMILGGYLMLLPEYGSLVSGFVALTMIIFGFCFLVPGIMTLSLQLFLRTFSRFIGISGRMALRNIQSGISRTGLAVAALTVAISVTVGVGVMVGSFRDTVILWLDQSLGGDIQISSQVNQENDFPLELQEQLSSLEGVLSVNGVILKRVESEFGQVRITVSDTAAQQSYYLKSGSEQGLADFNRGQGILISEPLAYRHELKVNDKVSLYTDKGAQSFLINGIFYDYTSSLGMIGLHQSLYNQWWNDTGFSRLTITARDSGTITTDLLPAVRAVLADTVDDKQGQVLFAISNGDIRQLTLNIFDRTFAITKVLRLLAILVAFVGVLSALMALQLERLREYALLRATGMTPNQIRGQVLSQTALMGLFAGLLSLPLGLIMSDVLIDVINKRSFGWSMQHVLPHSVLYEALALAVVAAILAGLYPAWRASGITPAAALREE